jgi:hypothetical protein
MSLECHGVSFPCYVVEVLIIDKYVLMMSHKKQTRRVHIPAVSLGTAYMR